MIKIQHERAGELLVLGQAIIYGLFPVILSYSGGKIPPLFFAATSTLLAGILVLIYLMMSKKVDDLFCKEAYPSLFRLSVLITLGYILFYLGGSQTTGINISILAQAEIVFTFVFAGLFFGESMPGKKILAAFLVLLGTLLVLYNGAFYLNTGDIYILAATAIFPFANRNAQQAMKKVSPQAVLFIRYVFSTVIFFTASWLWEGSWQYSFPSLLQQWQIILLNGFVLFALTKIMWYEGLKRIELSKAITLGMTFTAFGVGYSMVLLEERPSSYQMLGFLLVMVGIYVITRKNYLKTELVENP